MAESAQVAPSAQASVAQEHAGEAVAASRDAALRSSSKRKAASVAALSVADLAEGGAFAGWTRKQSKKNGESYIVSPGGEKLWEVQACKRMREMIQSA